jgi:MFS family permease
VSDAVGTRDGRVLALAVIVLSQFMVVLDTAIVNVALPSIKTELHFSQEKLQWVITGYSICFGGVLLLGGRLADLLGRRRVFMAGIFLFTISSLLDGLAWSDVSLITCPGSKVQRVTSLARFDNTAPTGGCRHGDALIRRLIAAIGVPLGSVGARAVGGRALRSVQGRRTTQTDLQANR